jgi:hypothetical protein
LGSIDATLSLLLSQIKKMVFGACVAHIQARLRCSGGTLLGFRFVCTKVVKQPRSAKMPNHGRSRIPGLWIRFAFTRWGVTLPLAITHFRKELAGMLNQNS